MRQGPRYFTVREPVSEPVIARRAQRLVAAGLDRPLAVHLAGDCAVDLHALLALVDHGCPPELAARIMAPPDEGDRPR